MSLIVIVDDRATNRTIYSQLAKSIGQNVAVKAFADPGEALVWLAANRADLIVTDYDMPNMDGGEFISRFRNLPHGQCVPIIMLTVCEKRILRLRALESGANDFLNTPIDHHEFLMRARNLLQLGRAVAAQTPAGLPETAPPESQEAAPPEAQKTAPPAAKNGTSARLGPVATRRAEAKRASPNPKTVEARALVPAAAPDRAASAWRIAPIVDLRAGGFAGGQLLRDGVQADAGDADSLRVALEILAGLGPGFAEHNQGLAEDNQGLAEHCKGLAEHNRGGPAPFRLSLRWDLTGAFGPEALLRLAAALGVSGVAASRLDLRVRAESLDRLGRRAEENARALRLLGLGLTLELGDPSTRQAARGNQAFALACCDRIALPAASPAARIQQLNRFFAPLPMLILGVPSSDDLRAFSRAGASFAQGDCLGAPLAPRDLPPAATGGPKPRSEKLPRSEKMPRGEKLPRSEKQVRHA